MPINFQGMLWKVVEELLGCCKDVGHFGSEWKQTGMPMVL